MRTLTVILLGVTLGCGGEAVGPGGGDTLLVVLPAVITLSVGQTRQLGASLVIDARDTTPAAAAWSSRQPAVATVTASGVVEGVAPGGTWVRAQSRGLGDSAAVTVLDSALGIPALTLVTDALSEPVFATAPPGDFTRLYVVEKGGRVRILRNDTLLAGSFLDLRGHVSTGSEQGLLSLAFHPSYATNGSLFVSYTDAAGDTRIVRYHATSPDAVDTTSATEILFVDQPFANHNGGLVAFGPDGMLYVGLGDGGAGGDPAGNGQNRGTLLGAILRLDVDAGSPYGIPLDNPFVGDANARPEIWAYGLRNPWRFSFDRVTGDLYIGDVGQNEREEVDVEPAEDEGGRNYGWNVMEGTVCYAASTCSMQGLVLPVLDYTHADGCSITGGYAYRGSAAPALAGRYFYADYCSTWMRSLTFAAGRATDLQEWPDLSPGSGVTSFAEDARGELYVMTQGGKLFRFVSR